ncbi:tRNA (guanosine(46)-N7)-methyltransferase TrmB [Kineococcus sp. SYSU DK003]|uniref:tRNA (guanosine(46)-N7)-methyltransferase TrmB n=1 Tax=Kineococcus sp. SYSU DK003 TaxID=3383124 RepID=UPI003D7CCB8C
MTSSTSTSAPTYEPVPSYKLRRGRMGVVRQEALETHLGRYAVPAGEGPLDLAALFGNDRPVVLEIGSGMGDATLEMAQADPGTNVVAAEVHTPGVARLVQGLAGRGLTNVRILEGDGQHLLAQRIGSGSLAGVRVFFPDPWPKARHHKRRLVAPAFAALVADRLAAGGLLHCATDWEPYAEQMAQVLAAEPRLALSADRARPAWRPVTRFEARGLALGHVVNDLQARRVA